MCVMVNKEARSLLYDLIGLKHIFLLKNRTYVAPKFSHLGCRILHVFTIYPYKFSSVIFVNTSFMERCVLGSNVGGNYFFLP